jgi:hypothetical protein
VDSSKLRGGGTVDREVIDLCRDEDVAVVAKIEMKEGEHWDEQEERASLPAVEVTLGIKEGAISPVVSIERIRPSSASRTRMNGLVCCRSRSQ